MNEYKFYKLMWKGKVLKIVMTTGDKPKSALKNFRKTHGIEPQVTEIHKGTYSQKDANTVASLYRLRYRTLEIDGGYDKMLVNPKDKRTSSPITVAKEHVEAMTNNPQLFLNGLIDYKEIFECGVEISDTENTLDKILLAYAYKVVEDKKVLQ